MRRARRAPPRRERWRFMVYGSLFGTAFPALATMLAAHHSALLAIIYVAPAVCGGMGFLIGREREKLLLALGTLDETVASRTAELRRAKEASDRLRASIHEGVLVLDPDRRIATVNEAACALLGRGEDDLVGRPFSELMAPAGRGETADPIARVLDGSGQESEAHRVTLLRADGSAVPTIFSASPVLDEDQALEAVVCVAYDISERLAAESRARQQDKLQTIGRLAAGIAHEINTPVQYISDNAAFLERAFGKIVGALETCRRLAEEGETCDASAREQARRAFAEARLDFLMEQVPGALAQTREGLDRVSHIVAAMKDFSHPSGGERQPADLATLLRTTTMVCRNEWKYVADVVIDAPDDLPPIPCVRDELSQVILNVVVNAAQAIGEQGRQERGRIQLSVRVCGEGNDRSVELRIEDDGPGIPEAHLDRIFDPFFTTKEVGKGTGQGLAIARAVVVERHGGTLDVTSQPGRGTTFTIRLPVDVEERREAISGESVTAVATRSEAA